MMIRAIAVPLLAFAGAGFACWQVTRSTAPLPAAAPAADPATNPFASGVAGAGLVEASTENIAIGTPVGGVVEEVLVEVGQMVERGAPLFRLDARIQQAALVSAEASLAVARAEHERLAKAPRSEDLPPVEARVREAEALLDEAKRQLGRSESAGGAVFSPEDIDTRRSHVAVVEARLTSARAELAKLRAGAWAPDLAVAAARVAQAEATVATARAEVERLTVRAPVGGTVLQVKIRAGEFAPSGVTATPLMLLGDISMLQARVDIDEHDAWRITPGAKAKASLRGNARITTDLTWLRSEPYIVPKRSLTGDSAERVDTRVLQVIYRFPRGELPIHVGQQLDVYIETVAP